MLFGRLKRIWKCTALLNVLGVPCASVALLCELDTKRYQQVSNVAMRPVPLHQLQARHIWQVEISGVMHEPTGQVDSFSLAIKRKLPEEYNQLAYRRPVSVILRQFVRLNDLPDDTYPSGNG